MKRRIVFCCDVPFPRGNAGANRVLYIAKALQIEKQNVLVLGHDNRDSDCINEYDGIEYCSFAIRHGKHDDLINSKIIGGLHAVKLLKKIHIRRDDIVYIYANNALFVSPVVNYCSNHGIKIYIDVVEWHQPYQYKGGILNARYQALNYTFKVLAQRIQNIVAISNKISEYYISRNCRVMIIPPLIEIREREIKAINNKRINLIYPGNPLKKDDIEVMLRAILLLPEDIKRRVVFHSTGISEGQLRKYLGNQENIIDELGDNFIIHGYISYDELSVIYSEMDFLLISRLENVVTESNFPSKLPELMERGIIPIVNKVGDFYKYLDDGVNAFLFNENTATACAKAIERALSSTNTDLELIKHCVRRCAIDKFDYKIWSKRIKDYILEE